MTKLEMIQRKIHNFSITLDDNVLKVENKVKKTVKRADDRIKSFNKFITGKTIDFKKIKLPEPIIFFKAKSFIKSLDRLQGAKDQVEVEVVTLWINCYLLLLVVQ